MKNYTLILFFFFSISIHTFAQWTLQNSGTSAALYSVDFINGNSGWVAGSSNIIKQTTDGGQNWILYSGYTYPVHETWYGTAFTNENEGYFCGSVYNYDRNQSNYTFTTNGGQNWMSQSWWGNEYSRWSDVFFLNETLGWKVGWRSVLGGRVNKTTTGVGNDWHSMTYVPEALYSIMFTDENHGWMVGSGGAIYNSIDGGTNWSPQNSNTTKTLKSVYFINSDIGWCTGYKDDQAIILKTIDGGQSWTSSLPANIRQLHSIYFEDRSIGWACGSLLATPDNKGVILYTEDGGDTWEIQHVENTCSTLYDMDFVDGVGYAVGSSGVILKLIYGDNFLRFTSLSNMKSKKFGFGYTTDGNYIYSVCGERPTPWPDPWKTTGIDRYDPATDSWAEIATGHIPRRFCSTEYVPSQHKIYILNGDTYSNSSYTDTVEIFDLSSGGISYSATNPYPVEYGGSAVWNNKIYVFGGSNADGYSRRFYEFDPSNTTWTRLPDMPERKQTNGEIVNGVLYVFGGKNYFTSKKIHAYDIENASWSFLGEMPLGVSAHATAKSGKYIWLIGSYNAISFIAVYDTETKIFTQKYSNMIGRRHAGASVIGNKLYVFGGNQASTDESILNSLQMLEISDFVDNIDELSGTQAMHNIVYPNPFSEIVTIEYELPVIEEALLYIYDNSGKQLAIIRKTQPVGKNQLRWNAKDYPDGIYYYRLKVGNKSSTGKILKLK